VVDEHGLLGGDIRGDGREANGHVLDHRVVADAIDGVPQALGVEQPQAGRHREGAEVSPRGAKDQLGEFVGIPAVCEGTARDGARRSADHDGGDDPALVQHLQHARVSRAQGAAATQCQPKVRLVAKIHPGHAAMVRTASGRVPGQT